MDPRMRKIISEYAPNVQDKIRRYYIASGPIHDHKFSPKTKKKTPIGGSCIILILLGLTNMGLD